MRMHEIMIGLNDVRKIKIELLYKQVGIIMYVFVKIYLTIVMYVHILYIVLYDRWIGVF